MYLSVTVYCVTKRLIEKVNFIMGTFVSPTLLTKSHRFIIIQLLYCTLLPPFSPLLFS